MKKTLKKLLASISAAAVLGTLSISASAEKTFYENDIKEIVSSDEHSTYIELNDGTNIVITEKSNFTVNYMVSSTDENVSNEYLGLSDKYTVSATDKITNDGKRIYSISVETEEEMEELFNASEALYENKKISNAYTCMDIMYSPFEYMKIDDEISYKIYTVNLYADMITYLNGVPEIVIVGDANGDNELNVSDCAFIARTLAKRETIDVTVNPAADYNNDGKVTVSDAATIARDLAKKG